MPRKKAEPTEQFNVLLPKKLVKRVRRYANANPLQPSNTQVAVAALTAFLDAAGVSEDDDKPHRKEPK